MSLLHSPKELICLPCKKKKKKPEQHVHWNDYCLNSAQNNIVNEEYAAPHPLLGSLLRFLDSVLSLVEEHWPWVLQIVVLKLLICFVT